MTSMIKLIKFSDFFTIGNLCCGVLAIFAAFDHQPEQVGFLILGSMLLDALDGKVAAWMHEKNALGRELDSLADLVSFGVAPAVLFYTLAPHALITTTILLVFISCGMLRLARYNISSGQGFEGVPITVNGLLFPALIFLSIHWPLLYPYWPFVFLTMGGLMVSSLKIRRLF